jgi:hypothetical protein
MDHQLRLPWHPVTEVNQCSGGPHHLCSNNRVEERGKISTSHPPHDLALEGIQVG